MSGIVVCGNVFQFNPILLNKEDILTSEISECEMKEMGMPTLLRNNICVKIL